MKLMLINGWMLGIMLACSLIFSSHLQIVANERVAFDQTPHMAEACKKLLGDMVYVQGGTFTMGDRADREAVTVQGFYICKYETTQALWEAVMGSNPSHFKGADRPVETVSKADCLAFIVKLNALTGREFRLPTEAEWEYAARGAVGSQGYKYCGGNRLSAVAWYDSNSQGETHPVGQKRANELGLYDMSGNVLEWCQNHWGKYSPYYSETDNEEAQSDVQNGVSRGGAWFFKKDANSLLKRYGHSPEHKSKTLGFRLALSRL